MNPYVLLKIKKMILDSRSIKRVIALDGYGIKIAKHNFKCTDFAH